MDTWQYLRIAIGSIVIIALIIFFGKQLYVRTLKAGFFYGLWCTLFGACIVIGMRIIYAPEDFVLATQVGIVILIVVGVVIFAIVQEKNRSIFER